MRETRRCLYCQRLFLPSPCRPQQRVCSRPDCQRRRRADSRRQQLAQDPVYVQVVRDSRKRWWDEHPNYQKERRKANPEVVERNRQRKHIRDQKRRLARLVRNNLVLDLTHSASAVWLVGPQVQRLDRNNLVSTQVLILSSVGQRLACPALLDRNNHLYRIRRAARESSRDEPRCRSSFINWTTTVMNFCGRRRLNGKDSC